jgi:hypothetical protein
MSILQPASTVICHFDNSLCWKVCQDVCIVCNDKIVGNVPYWPKQTRLEASGGKKDVHPCICLYIDSIFTWIVTSPCAATGITSLNVKLLNQYKIPREITDEIIN